MTPSSAPRTRTCPDCSGAGLATASKCSRCHGLGRVATTQRKSPHKGEEMSITAAEVQSLQDRITGLERENDALRQEIREDQEKVSRQAKRLRELLAGAWWLEAAGLLDSLANLDPIPF